MSKKRHEPHEEHPDESWLLPYSDLMTLLLALFIVLYSASAVNISKIEEMSLAFKSAFSSGIGVLDSGSLVDDNQLKRRTDDTKTRQNDGSKREDLQAQEQQNLEELQQQLNLYIQENGLSSQLDTTLNQSELLITIRDNALFTSGSANIKPESQKLAVAIGQMLQSYPDYEIIISGHTDNQPIKTLEFPSNWELSFKRAVNFMNILLENEAFDPKRFSPNGNGEYHPVSPNDSAAGRAANRRVELSLLRKYTEPTVNTANEINVSAVSEAAAIN